MSRAIAVLRPEPGNRVTAAAIEGQGRTAIRLPLFEARAIDWDVPDPAGFDALIVTSANAIRHGGAGLAQLLALPAHAVGEATAEAARRVGFQVAATGSGGSAELLAAAEAGGVRRALHLAGRERLIAAGGIVAEVRTVYASEPREIGPEALRRIEGAVAMIHSPRAGAQFGTLLDAAGIARGAIALAAISAEAAGAAGAGWGAVALAAAPSDAALVRAAIALAD